jgi:colanic acid biosynthesis glycosyl transferase WcaI
MGAPAARAFELAREWCRMGHRVTVLTGFPNHPSGHVPEPYRRQLWRLTVREEIEGVSVVRTWVYPAANRGTFKRGANYLSFCASAIARGFALEPPDIVIGSSPQPLAAAAARVLAARFNQPFIFEVRDLWPESLPAVGQSGERTLLFQLVRRLTDRLYRAAALIVPVSERFVPFIIARAPEAHVELVENGVDTELFRPPADRDELKASLNLQNRFVVTYAGTMGMAHRLETVLAAAQTLRSRRSDVVFLLIGDGAERTQLEQLSRDLALDNVRFLGQIPRVKLVDYIGASDACLVLLRRAELFETVLPSKMLEFMACGAAMIVGVNGLARELAEQSGGGLCIAPESSDEIVAAVDRLYSQPALSRELGRSGREYVLRCFTRQQKARKYLDAMMAVAASVESDAAVQESHR